MQSEVIARYLTRTGKVGLEVIRAAAGSYRYTGEWGAGCGSDKAEIEARVMRIISHKRGLRVVNCAGKAPVKHAATNLPINGRKRIVTDTTNTSANTEQSGKQRATPCVAGLEMRDYFAAKALQGICASGPDSTCSDERIARESYALADAMLKERSKP